MTPRRSGFTLVELMIALAILALVAVLGYRALASLTDSEAQLTAEAQRWRDLDALFARIEADMRDALPRDVRTDGGTEPAWIGVVDGDRQCRLALLPRRPGVRGRAGKRRPADRLPLAQRRGRGPLLAAPRPAVVRCSQGVRAGDRHRRISGRLPRRARQLARALAVAGESAVPRAVRVALTFASGEDDRTMAGAAMSRARGAAIVLAMLIAALAAAVAATVFADQQRWSRTVEHRRDQVQAQALAMAGVQWARQILDDDARRSEIDHLGEPWAVALPPIPLDNGEIRGAIADAQGRLNINALGDAGATAAEERRRASPRSSRSAEDPPQRSTRSPTGSTPTAAPATSAPRTRTTQRNRYRASPPNVPVVRVAELAPCERRHAAGARRRRPVPVGTARGNAGQRQHGAGGSAGDDRRRPRFRRTCRRSLPVAHRSRSRRSPNSGRDCPAEARCRARRPLSVKSSFFYVTVEARQGATLARARALLHRSGNAWPAIAWQVVE